MKVTCSRSRGARGGSLHRRPLSPGGWPVRYPASNTAHKPTSSRRRAGLAGEQSAAAPHFPLCPPQFTEHTTARSQAGRPSPDRLTLPASQSTAELRPTQTALAALLFSILHLYIHRANPDSRRAAALQLGWIPVMSGPGERSMEIKPARRSFPDNRAGSETARQFRFSGKSTEHVAVYCNAKPGTAPSKAVSVSELMALIPQDSIAPESVIKQTRWRQRLSSNTINNNEESDSAQICIESERGTSYLYNCPSH